MRTKICKTCQEEKDFSEFSYNSRTRDKILAHCKICIKKARSPTELEIINKNLKSTEYKWS